jgi:hypothetical protein
LIYKRYYSTSNTDDVKEEADITAANAKSLVQINLFSQEPVIYHNDNDFINTLVIGTNSIVYLSKFHGPCFQITNFAV